MIKDKSIVICSPIVICNPIFTLLILIFFAILSVSAHQAFADSEKDKAQIKFSDGMEFFKQHNYLEALASFEKSYDIKPKTLVLYKIAMCQKKLFRYLDSTATFKKLLINGKSKIKKNMRKKVEKALDEMQNLIGRIKIVAAPRNAEVIINGTLYGTTPILEEIFLDPGQNTILIKKEGYKSDKTEILVTSNALIPIRGVLIQKKVQLIIKCNVKIDTEVFVNEKRLGQCPFDEAVESGEIEVVVKSPQMKNFEKILQAKGGATITVNAMLWPQVEQKQMIKKDVSPLAITGLTTCIIGIGAGAVGGGFMYRLSQNIVDGEHYDDQLEYDNAQTDYSENKRFVMASFISAGILITTGIVLLIANRQQKKKTKAKQIVVSLPDKKLIKN